MGYIEDMRKNIASILSLELNQISIKAKTNEKMDSTGEGLAIVANAICLVEKI
jgi:2-C-methyl-D-erythritol 2,4-cyclodiphosphate synthase